MLIKDENVANLKALKSPPLILECFFECSHTILGNIDQYANCQRLAEFDQYEGHEIAPLNTHDDSQFVYFSGPKEQSEN